jgi:hypothetical protein
MDLFAVRCSLFAVRGPLFGLPRAHVRFEAEHQHARTIRSSEQRMEELENWKSKRMNSDPRAASSD